MGPSDFAQPGPGQRTRKPDSGTALPTREEYLSMVFNSSREMMLFGRIEPGTLFRAVSVNRSYVETVRKAGFDITAADFEGKTFEEITARLGFDWAHVASIRKQFVQAIEGGQPVHYDELTPTPSGFFHGRTTITPIAAPDGSCGFVLYSSQDITEQVQAAESLRESEEKFAKAFRASPFPLTISDLATGCYIDVNLGFERVSNYGRSEIIGRTSLELGFWKNPADRDELLRRLERDGSVREMEINFVSRSGRIVIARCSCERLELGGRACLLSVLEDVTGQRETERQHAMLEAQLRQTQKLEALGTLAGGIAHDFNNILTAIIVNQQLAVMEMNNAVELRICLNEICRASTRAKELVAQILAFSRRQEPRMRVAQPLGPIINEAMALVRASIPTWIDIVTELNADAPRVLADATQIHQIIMNLCANAAHAMRLRPGCLTVHLGSRVLTDEDCTLIPGTIPGLHAQLTVRDTGHGMDDALLTRIYEPFFTTKPAGEGTGLGLPVIHGIVKDHGGAILVQSTPGEGTTFELLFPEAIGAETAECVTKATIVRGHGERILVIDDEESILRGLEAILVKSGYKPVVFADSTKALAHFEADPNRFDVVLTDLTMPRLTGPELIMRVRQKRPRIPVILMTGGGSPGLRNDVQTDARLHVVGKPLDIVHLSKVLRRVLNSPPF
jgi:two-component system, cell cycle sensor histidine kinase and response regulator CckA